MENKHKGQDDMTLKKAALALLLCLTTGMLSGCARHSTALRLSGSTSMEELAKAFAEDCGQEADVQLGGSSVGIRNVLTGVCQIGMVSRALLPEEAGLTAVTAALDPICVVISRKNPIQDLTHAQIAAIFTGQVSNWRELGGPDRKIAVIGQEAGSGTRDTFERCFGIAGRAAYHQELSGTGMASAAVASAPGGIGYLSLAYLGEGVKAVRIDGIACCQRTVKDGSYPVVRPLLFVTREGEQSAAVRQFLSYVRSARGRRIVEQLNLTPPPEEEPREN